MRAAVFIIGGLETAAVLAVVWIVASSGQFTSLASIVLYIFGLPCLAFTLPALVMAALNRALPVALALCVLAIAASLIIRIFCPVF
jgi:hypothetical protein